ncbi:DNA repair protein RadA/Sms [Lachnospiraceae bacterium NE2001]|nr:DNA repair protein RadA/Sms [Lachnospiraceae bacterium NE2001]
MAKEKQVFYCKECGNEFSRWMGQCPSCKAWNSFVEEKVTKTRTNKTVSVSDRPRATSIKNISSSEETRISTRIKELDRVLGGGIVKGSLVLVGGDPGIGKSTLLLEMCRNLVTDEVKVLYVSGEESTSQIKSRAVRLGITPGSPEEERLLILSDNDMDNIESQMENLETEVVIIDSIQTIEAASVESAPGTVSQVREVTARLLQIAKQQDIAIFIVGHVTKEGTVAGPRTLEHMVDSVLYFEGDDSGGFRLLRANKNRFGSTNEIGVFNMTDSGLEEVTNPSEFFLNGRPENSSGSSVVCIVEGTRAMLVEIQALCTDSNFSMPRRTSVGLDYNRVGLLTAVLEKRGGISLSGCDCYVNVAGGLKINDPSTDLGVVCAVASSFRDRAIDSKTVIVGEIGLAGEVRGIRNISQRLKEAAKLGYTKAIVPKSNYNKELEKLGVDIIYVSTIRDALDKI